MTVKFNFTMYNIFGVLYFIFFLSTASTAQDLHQLNNNEKEYKQVFDGFKQYIVNSIQKDVDISDTINIKFALLNFILSDSPLDTLDKTHLKENEISIERMNEFVSEFRGFYQFFLERSKQKIAQHLAAIPLRLSSDKCIYEKLTPFQRENTFVYFDDRNPEKPLGYMLFVPKFKKTITATRIWSWTLMFQSGYWMFKSPMGELGMEYFVSEGVKGPKPENRIGN